LPRGTSRCDCEAAAKSGRHVFCEKPLCTAAEDAERAIAAIKKASVQLGIGHERRFEPAVIELRKRFADGEFGNALVLEGNFSQDSFSTCRPATGACPTRSTPLALCQLPESILSIFRSRFSESPHRSGYGWPHSEAISPMAIRFRSPSALGVVPTATLNAVLATPFMGHLALLGSNGWMEIRDRTHPENPTGWDVTRVLRDRSPETAYYQPHPAVRDNLESFGRAALGKGSYPVTHDEMLSNVRTFEAIQRSASSGRIEPV
jgi:predicted dehydrogenase